MFLVNRIFAPCQKRGLFAKNGENDEFGLYPLTNKGFAPQTPENDEMAGVTHRKAWFRKGRVSSSLSDSINSGNQSRTIVPKLTHSHCSMRKLKQESHISLAWQP